jgi:hypothetical protein
MINTAWVRAQLCKLQKKKCTRLAAASDKVYQLLAQGGSLRLPRHDIAEILLKVPLSTINQ